MSDHDETTEAVLHRVLRQCEEQTEALGRGRSLLQNATTGYEEAFLTVRNAVLELREALKKTPEPQDAPTRRLPSIGRIVHYVLPNGAHKGDHRAAIITWIWSNTCVNLQVFCDGTNDTAVAGGLFVCASVPYSTLGSEKPGTWHWPEDVAPMESPCTD